MTMPSVLSNGRSRGYLEVLQLIRQKDALIFTFAFPALLTILLGLIFDTPVMPGSETTHSQVFAAGMIAYGILSTAFISIGIGIAVDRGDGTLKRLRGTPVTAGAYFLGKIVLVFFAAVFEVALLLLVGVLMFDLPLPADVSHWVTFTWLMMLSVIACTLLGIAASSLASSARSAPAVLNLPVLVLQFTSGIFVHIAALPSAMVNVSALFPIKWMGQGFRSVFLPDALASEEVAGSWEPGRTALVLLAWCVIGLVLSLLTFRWSRR
ncbi:ABC transporter permease [Micromonospora parathelypteridis]|uniref:Transport permease protein n=1 Tax=Micromonospora parathelypteridis TaxID=1839617 RepID=A0A840WB74_9ACTN|nr:ABC transporter permease [Micromonospora parathelypteridis]MBB5480241.1 ABC-2 type transport system permease protein [Micromonospora parathelypteridis]GGO24292.1 transport permease protein [Micromonospora parathelypteridis]